MARLEALDTSVAVETIKAIKAIEAFEPGLDVCLVYSPAPRTVREWALHLPTGSNVRQAVQLSGVFEVFTELQHTNIRLGIWGKRVSLQHILQAQDRIEIYRDLRVDPKVARRERFKGQGAKRAGLFASKRVGAKAGY